MQRNYEESMALVRKFGKPDYFVVQTFVGDRFA